MGVTISGKCVNLGKNRVMGMGTQLKNKRVTGRVMGN